MRHKKFTLSVVSILAVSSVAYANAGTPLMWAGIFHLAVGNAIIGLFEGVALALVFKLPKFKTIALLILANYFSAWVGATLLREAIAIALPMDLNNLRLVFWTTVLITYVITLFLEFPFVLLALSRNTRRIRDSLIGTLAVQTASYAFLFWCYWHVSGISLLTEIAVVEPETIPVPADVAIYFISTGDGDVYEMRLVETAKTTKVFDLNSRGLTDRLLFRPSAEDEDKQELVNRIETSNQQEPMMIGLHKFFSRAATPLSRAEGAQTHPTWGTWLGAGEALALGDAESSPWEFSTGFWPVEGIQGTNRYSGARAGFSFETPFGAWIVRNAIHLPMDKILLQLGDDQICLYDPLTQRIALLTRGRGPTAAITRDEVD